MAYFVGIKNGLIVSKGCGEGFSPNEKDCEIVEVSKEVFVESFVISDEKVEKTREEKIQVNEALLARMRK